MSFPRYPKYKDSGVEWLGAVPEHWGLRRIGYFFTERREKVSDKDFPPLSVTKDGIVPQLDTAAKSDDGDNRRRVCKGDFVINSRSDRKGSSGASELDGSVSLICTVMQPQEKVHTPFVHHLLRSQPFQEEFYRNGKGIVADLWSTNYSEMRNILLGMPPLAEQTQIAAFLDRETAKIDELVAEQRRLMELLKEKRQAVISHAVTKGLNPDAPMKSSGIEWLGDVPKHWWVMPIRMIANVVRGASPRPAGDPRYFGGEAVPWVTVGEITKDDGVYLSETESCLTQEGATHSNLFRRGTLIYSNSGATLGVPKILRIDACANDGVVAFLHLNKDVHAEFLYHYLASITDCIRDKVKQGSGQPNLNTDIVKDLRFGLPPLDEQKLIVERITEVAEQFGSLTTEAQRAIDLLQERRTALISAAVTGQIDIRALTERKAA
jgi:type I restriction enzyme S subunit